MSGRRFLLQRLRWVQPETWTTTWRKKLLGVSSPPTSPVPVFILPLFVATVVAPRGRRGRFLGFHPLNGPIQLFHLFLARLVFLVVKIRGSVALGAAAGLAWREKGGSPELGDPEPGWGLGPKGGRGEPQTYASQSAGPELQPRH